MNRSTVMLSPNCRHCGVPLYAAPTTYTKRSVKGSSFTAPLRRNYWHNGTAEEVMAASRAASVDHHHTPEP